MAWRQIGDKPFSEPWLTRSTAAAAYIQHHVEVSINDVLHGCAKQLDEDANILKCDSIVYRIQLLLIERTLLPLTEQLQTWPHPDNLSREQFKLMPNNDSLLKHILDTIEHPMNIKKNAKMGQSHIIWNCVNIIWYKFMYNYTTFYIMICFSNRSHSFTQISSLGPDPWHVHGWSTEYSQPVCHCLPPGSLYVMGAFEQYVYIYICIYID